MWLVVVASAAALAGAACSDSGEPAAPTATPGPSLAVSDAAGRLAMGRGAVYFRITNSGAVADALIGASTPAARTVELHETVMEGAMAKMQPVPRIEVPAYGEQVLKPGGYHVMMFDFSEPLKIGDTISVTLTFEKSAPMTISVPIREFPVG
jgi:copper(I)-binding protein